MRRHLIVLGCAAWALAACQPNGSRSTIDLLQAGDSGVCVASDVEDTLRGFIKPKGMQSADYGITFDDTTLEGFDKTVKRATCNTYLTITGPNGPVVERTSIDYVVIPAAQNPDTIMVTANVQPFAEQLRTVIGNDTQAKAANAAEEQQKEAMTALVKPGWLIGRWFDETSGSQVCATGPYDDFARGGRYDTGTMKGRWSLEELSLTEILPTSSTDWFFTAAANDVFTVRNADGEQFVYRRCTRTDMRPATVAEPTAPPADTLTDDLAEAEKTAQEREP